MTVTYYTVRLWCETCGEYKRVVQATTVNPSWKPEGCAEHTTRDFVIETEKEEEE